MVKHNAEIREAPDGRMSVWCEVCLRTLVAYSGSREEAEQAVRDHRRETLGQPIEP